MGGGTRRRVMALRCVVGRGLLHCALALLLLASGRPAAAADLSTDQTARILAGLEANPAGLPPASVHHLRAYSQLVATSWGSYQRRIGNPMRDWARQELPDSRGATIFYPFSGPDFATVAQLYPGAKRYVLVAIQPAGAPPPLARQAPADFAAYLARFREGWQRFAGMGFFLTSELDADARQAGNRVGVTALLMAFAALQGYEVTALQPIRIAADGAGLEPRTGDPRRDWDSVRLTLARGGDPVILDYVRLDLSDAALLRQPAMRAWLESVAGNPTVLKAASHLPQNAGFTIIRDAILDRAASVWQDETGIEYGLLAERFNVSLYGRFTKANNLFSAGSQRSLALAYERTGARAKPIDFRVGYLKESGWSVQYAQRDAARVAARGDRPAHGAGAAGPEIAAPLERQIAALEARVKRELARARERPRKVFVGGSTREEPLASYVKAVHARIAQSPDLMVAGSRTALVSLAIAADGTLQGVEFDRASGSTELDAALRAAARRAAPFPPLPQTLRADADVLVLTLQLPDHASLKIASVAAIARADTNPCALPFSKMIDSRAARPDATAVSSTEPGERHFQIGDAMNTWPGISEEDDLRYNYRSRYLVADLDTRSAGGQCRGLEERYPYVDPARPDVETFPELQDPETLEHFIRNVQGTGPGRGYFEAPTAKQSVVRMKGVSYCIGQTISLCEIRQGQPVEIARLGTSGLMSNAGPARHFYVPLNTIVLRSWMLNRRYTPADARRDASLGGIAGGARSGALLSYYRPQEVDWVMPNFLQWLPVDGFAHDNTVKGLHELSLGETRINNLGAPVSHGCLRLTRYGAVLARWWTPRGARLFIHYTNTGYRETP